MSAWGRFFLGVWVVLVLGGVCSSLAWGQGAVRAPLALASPVRVEVLLERARVDLGEPVLLAVRWQDAPAAGAASALGDLDWRAALGADFDIAGQSRGEVDGREQITLTLYPRRSGDISIALPLPLQVAGPSSSGATLLQVGPGGQSAPWVRIRLSSPATKWLVREPSEFTLEVCTTGNLLWQRPEVGLQDGLTVTWLRESQIDIQTEQGRCTATRWVGQIVPAAPGPQRLALGWVSATHFGRTLRWPVPALEFEARAVPLWLPAGLPGQAPAVQDVRAPSGRGPGQLAEWRFQVVGTYTEPTLRALLQSQLDAADWGQEPPAITSVLRDDGQSVWEVRLYQRMASGAPQHMAPGISAAQQLTPPTLRLPWFDLQAGRLHHVPVTLPALTLPARVTPLPPDDGAQGRRLLWPALGVLGLLALLRWQRHTLRRALWLLRLARCSTPEALARTLMQDGRWGRAVTYPSLQDWHAASGWAWPAAPMRQWIDDFDALRFGAPGAGRMTFETSRAQLRQLVLRCRRTMPRSLLREQSRDPHDETHL